jgi:hypothetical protein
MVINDNALEDMKKIDGTICYDSKYNKTFNALLKVKNLIVYDCSNNMQDHIRKLPTIISYKGGKETHRMEL